MIELSSFHTLLSLVILTGHQTSVHMKSLILCECLHVCVIVLTFKSNYSFRQKIWNLAKKVHEFECRGRQLGIERKIKRVCDQEGGGDTAGEK